MIIAQVSCFLRSFSSHRSKVHLPGFNPEDEIGSDAVDDRCRRQTGGSSSSGGSEEYLGPLPGLDVVLQDGGQLTNAMVNFLAEMNAPSAKLSVISPGNLFTQICKKTPRFKGFQQQVMKTNDAFLGWDGSI